MRHVLVVANETLVGTHLTRRLHDLNKVEPIDVHVVVPATGSGFDDAVSAANENLERGLAAIRKLGIDAQGRIGSPDPMVAIDYALTRAPAINLILLSTLPVGRSRWLAMDLPHRVSRRFQIALEHVEGAAADQEMQERSGIRPLKVMVVEDDANDLELAKLALEGLDAGIQVLPTGTGEAAIHFIREAAARPDLVLLDLKMPGMGGFEMLEELEEKLGLDTLNELNIVVLSSSSAQADRDRAHALGARAYVVKQPDFDEFQASLGSLIAEVSAQQIAS